MAERRHAKEFRAKEFRAKEFPAKEFRAKEFPAKRFRAGDAGACRRATLRERAGATSASRQTPAAGIARCRATPCRTVNFPPAELGFTSQTHMASMSPLN
jgi:hypothetical protein